MKDVEPTEEQRSLAEEFLTARFGDIREDTIALIAAAEARGERRGLERAAKLADESEALAELLAWLDAYDKYEPTFPHDPYIWAAAVRCLQSQLAAVTAANDALATRASKAETSLGAERARADEGEADARHLLAEWEASCRELQEVRAQLDAAEGKSDG